MFDLTDFTLRPLEAEDKPLIRRWRNTERVRRNMYSDHLISEDEHSRWFDLALTQPEGYVYRIFLHQGRPIGFVSFTQINHKHGHCNWAFYIGEEDVPRGVGSVLEFMSLEFVFGEMGIRKLSCEVFSFNAAVVKLHGKFGFVREGCLVDQYLKDGKYEDVLILALFEESWRSLREDFVHRLFRGH